MRGEFLPVWADTWRDIWSKLAKHPDAPDDLFSELYRAMAIVPVPPIEPAIPKEFDFDGKMTNPKDIQAERDYRSLRATYELARSSYETAVSGDRNARNAFRREVWAKVVNEREAISLLGLAFTALKDVENGFTDLYLVLTQRFIAKYSLRYDLRTSFRLCPTLPGIFSGLVRELQTVARSSRHLQMLLTEFEDSIRGLHEDASPAHMKICMLRQFNLLEGLGRERPEVGGTTLGAICGEVQSWPHASIREAAKKLYGFRSDYPGLGHSGNPNGVLRDIEMRDLVAISVLLAGLVPYLSHQVDSNTAYRG